MDCCRVVFPEARRDFSRFECAATALENIECLFEIIHLEEELSSLPDELRHLGSLLRIHHRLSAFVDEDGLETIRSSAPLLAFHVHRSGMPHEVGLAIALRGFTIAFRLLEHFRRDTLEIGLQIAIGGLGPGFLLPEDRTRRLVIFALEMELSRLEETILVMTNLGGPNEFTRLDEKVRGVIELFVIPQELGRANEVTLFLERVRLLQDSLGHALVGARVDVPWRVAVCLFDHLPTASPEQPDAKGEQHETDRKQHEPEKGFRNPLFGGDREVARNRETLVDQPSIEDLELTPDLIRKFAARAHAHDQPKRARRDKEDGEGQRQDSGDDKHVLDSPG